MTAGAPGAEAAPRWRAVDGVLLLDKHTGISSHAAVQRVRRLLGARKAGHTGTLDPMASGLLPVCLGEATKFSHLLLDADKAYEATIRLGVTTTTGDLEGEVLSRAPVGAARAEVERALRRWTGEILQTPPMYSAIKLAGQPLYRLARAGREAPRVPRRVVIRELDLVAFDGVEVGIRLVCSKGTYVRVLAEDIGRSLGCGGCLSRLRRTAVGPFSLAGGAMALAALEAMPPSERERVLLAADALVEPLPRLDLDAGEAGRLVRGQAVEHAGAHPVELARIYGPNREFLGVARVFSPGRIVPKRLVSGVAAGRANRPSIA